MKNIKAYAVIDAGYGDSGKGLMTDYFCHKGMSETGSVLNIKTNGGHQAGHTVCRMDWENKCYNRNVFHTAGSGTFAGADTMLGSRFMLNPEALLHEMDYIQNCFNITPKVMVNPECRIVFKADALLNRAIEQARKNKHGTCGMGIFEAVNRNHKAFKFTVEDFMKQNTGSLYKNITSMLEDYIIYRIGSLKEEKVVIDDTAKDSLITEIHKETMKDFHSLNLIVNDNRIKILTLNDVIKNDYQHIVFECSQGLELDWDDERNYPHVTASHTGLVNIGKEIITLDDINNILSFEACYITRSYKTKHGDGIFYEEDKSIEKLKALHDRTNIPNEYQGTIKYGLLDIQRMKSLISKDIKRFEKITGQYFTNHKCNSSTKYSLAVTHLDQTQESILTNKGEIYFKTLTASDIFSQHPYKTYYSFGEKAEDIIACYHY